mgnify:FL=1
MTKKHLPKFKSYAEEARFWDTHDLTDYFDRNKKVVLDFSGVKKKKESVLTVRLQPELKMKLGAAAEEMGIQASTLARMWLVEKLRG